MEQLVNVITVIGVVFLFITFIVNKRISELVSKSEITVGKKKIKIGTLCLKGFLIMCYISVIIVCIVNIITRLVYYFELEELDFEETISKNKEEIQIETDYYNEIINKIYNIENCKNPYIIDGFEYVEGTWNTGYVIQDSNGNQFVWVPCTNIENEFGIEKLKKNNFSNDAFIKSFYCNEENYEEFLTSALENGGFYISRFEIGKDDNDNPVSQKNYKIWTNITRDEAMRVANEMYSNINSELINGYAYDTTLSWIINSEEIELKVKNESKYTGTQSYKNIYDILDNIYELTTEKSSGEVIYRGIIPDTKYMTGANLDNRLSGSNNYKYENLGFRTILYK